MIAVLDASVTIARYHFDEVTPVVSELFLEVEYDGAVAPPFWKVEVANVLQVKVRKDRYAAEERNRILTDIGDLPVTIDTDALTYLWTTTVDLAHRHLLTV